MANTNDYPKKIAMARKLLSPYLDGEVTAEERSLVEEALAVDDSLQAELDSLQATVDWLHALPAAVPPRPFTLSEADVPAPKVSTPRAWLMPTWLKLWGSAAVGVLCIVAVGGVLLMQQLQGGWLSSPAADVAMVEEVVEPQASAPDMEKAAEESGPLPAQPVEITAEVQAEIIEEEAPAEEAAEDEASAGYAGATAAETNQLVADQADEPAPAPELAREAESEGNEAPLKMLPPGEDDGMAPPAGAIASEPPPPPSQPELMAVPPKESPPLPEVRAAESAELIETSESEATEAAALAKAEASPTPVPTPAPSPPPTPLAELVSPAESEETPLMPPGVVLIVLLGLALILGGVGIWWFWQKQHR